ncbi:unnamed protein product [Medioppia subpectinata]|uniref:protein-serine/threonine phosphatase n=1 Tax=Medioppia subpectinata TaxID=1979941 RepID=A0A7R9KV53_9ACAR|nr:unnamed protein product [Medioppia subpectinata]CAG2109297.1 unnamed protein product [Medioppia subpectinata]
MFPSNKIFSQSLQNAYNNCRVEEMLSKIYLKSAVTKAKTGSGALRGRLSYGMCSVQGWRKYQEDAHVAITNFDDNHSLFAVFDGHNGPEVALLAGKRLPELIKSNKNFQIGNIEIALEEVFMAFDAILLTRATNDQLFGLRRGVLGENMAPTDRPAITSGCTALVVLIANDTDTIYVANIGDSRCLLYRSRKTIALSNDHKPEDRCERKRIERSGGHVIEGRINGGLNLSRAFGDHQYKRNKAVSAEEQMVSACPEIKVKQLKIKKDDFLVIACDGIWNSMSNSKVSQFVSKRIKSEKLTTICHEMIHRCMSPVRPVNGIGGDNMTAIVVKFDGE